jgi:hypothetical protein
MKTFLTKCLQFICFAAVFYAVSLIICEEYLPASLTPNINYKVGSYGHMNSRIKEIPNYPDVDILILGSSHAYRGFDTRIFAQNGLRIYNLGSSAQTPIQTSVLLNRYLDELNPELILYEVYPGTFTSDGVESALDLLANDNNDLLSIQMALKINNIKVYNTLIYAIYNDLFSLDRDFSENRIKGSDTYIEGGYVEKTPNFNKKENDYEPRVWNLRQYQLSAFEDILSTLRENDIEVILIQAPITSNRYNAYQNNAEINEYFSQFGNYFNFNEMIILSDHDHFYDDHHMNQAGVQIFNQEVLTTLYANGFITIDQ